MRSLFKSFAHFPVGSSVSFSLILGVSALLDTYTCTHVMAVVSHSVNCCFLFHFMVSFDDSRFLDCPMYQFFVFFCFLCVCSVSEIIFYSKGQKGIYLFS